MLQSIIGNLHGCINMVLQKRRNGMGYIRHTIVHCC